MKTTVAPAPAAEKARRGPTLPPRMPAGPLNGRRAGDVAHRIIGDFVARDVYRPTPEQIASTVAHDPETKRVVVSARRPASD